LGLELYFYFAFLLLLLSSGAQALPLVAQLVCAQTVATHDRGGKNAAAPIREHNHLSATPSDQCRQRVHQRQDSMGEVHGTRISEQAELCQRDLLPLWRPGPCPIFH